MLRESANQKFWLKERDLFIYLFILFRDAWRKREILDADLDEKRSENWKVEPRSEILDAD